MSFYVTKEGAVGVLDLKSVSRLLGYNEFKLPAGLRVVPVSYKDGTKEPELIHGFFLEEFRDYVPNHLHHDATYRGVRISANEVELVD